ncbi:hypothetical protein [Jatrophihabitans endophyticus]|uniref:hypothetical protein n=1 Tax=Jatrophihabitans endophyticus TaxID=1206085 RepID=UPI0019E38E20|nr:hypothetical protein [Jatrophihabitans endophyticus]
MDDEPLGMSVAVLDDHLATCADCARWVEAATNATRLVRLDVTPVPDLADAIIAGIALPARRVARRRLLLRVGLVVAAVVQLVVGIPATLGDSMAMPMAAHAAHEMAAWNIALGVAFVAAALLPRRAAGMIPLLTAFLAVLGVLSVHDYLDGAVTAARLATHAAALVGLALLVGLDRTERARPPVRVRQERRDDDGDTTLRTVA